MADPRSTGAAATQSETADESVQPQPKMPLTMPILLHGQNGFTGVQPTAGAMMGFDTNGDVPVQAAAPSNGKMTADDIALYDRQIRLWGMKAQEKIQSANVLLINMRALGNEIAKNLVLAGIKSLTIVDEHLVTEADLGAQFFLSQEHVGLNRAYAVSDNIRKLNPRVHVVADPLGVLDKPPGFFANFDVTIATDLDPNMLTTINTATRLAGRKFFAAASHGLYGYLFSDLIEHEYVLTREKGNVVTKIGPESRTRSVVAVSTKKEGDKTMEVVTKREVYSTWAVAAEGSMLPNEYNKSARRLKAVTPILSCLRALWKFWGDHRRDPGRDTAPQQVRQDLEMFTKSATARHQALGLPQETLRSEVLRSFLQNIGCEIAPVTAILGAQLAGDVIVVLGQNQQPIQNMVVFDGSCMQSEQYPLHPDGLLGKAQLEMASFAAPLEVPPIMTFQGAPPPEPCDPMASTLGVISGARQGNDV